VGAIDDLECRDLLHAACKISIVSRATETWFQAAAKNAPCVLPAQDQRSEHTKDEKDVIAEPRRIISNRQQQHSNSTAQRHLVRDVRKTIPSGSECCGRRGS